MKRILLFLLCLVTLVDLRAENINTLENYTLDPPTSSTLNAFSQIKVTFPDRDTNSELIFTAKSSKGTITNGTETYKLMPALVTAKNYKIFQVVDENGNYVTIISPGEWKLKLEKGAIYTWNFDTDQTVEESPEITATYTINGEASFVIGGLEFTALPGKVHEVEVRASSTLLSGEVIIPETVNYEGIEYSVTSIGASAFRYSWNLTSIVLPNSITSIGEYAFDYCAYLTSIQLSHTLRLIGKNAFSLCSMLDSIEIPDSVIEIGDEAFGECDHLVFINLPASVITIGVNVFYMCLKLEEINVDSENPYYYSKDGVLYERSTSKLIRYPCGKHESEYSIPDNVKSIGDYAFSDCHYLYAVCIPSSLTEIGKNSFRYWYELSQISIDNPIPPTVATGALDGYSLNEINIIVPSLLVETYKNAEGWRDHNIVGFLPKNLSNGKSVEVLRYYANSISGIQFDVETPQGVELNFAEKAIGLMTLNKSEIEGGKTRYVAYTNNGKTLSVDFILTASAPEAKRGYLRISNIITSESDEPERTEDIEIPVLGYGLNRLTLPDVQEDTETYLSTPNELEGIDGLTISWIPYSSSIGTLSAEGLFTVFSDGTIDDLPLQIHDPLIGTLDVTATLNITLLLGDVDRSGTIDIADVVAVVNYILMRDPDPFDFKRADLDGSGDINIADLTRLVKLVLAQPKEAPTRRHARARSAEGEMHLSVPTTGETVDGKRHVYVHLDTNREYTAMQVDLQTTGGARIASINAGPGIDSHVMDHAAIDPTTTRVLLYSHNLASLPAGDHIIDVTLADNNADVAPDAQILATSAISADADGQAYTHATASANIGDISTGLESVYTETMRITTAPGRIIIEAPAASTITITDLQGRTLGTWTGTGSLDLSRGLYIVSATNCRPRKVEVR